MKKNLSTLLALALLLVTVFAYTVPIFAEGDADAVSSATVKEEGTDASYTDAKPTTTPVKVTTTSTTSTVAGDKVYYVVKSGDVLWKIAKANGLTLDQIKALNPQIKNFNRIKIGDKIVVKVVVAAPVKPVAPVTPAEPAKPVVVVPKEIKLSQGLGQTQVFRARGTSYSFNVTMASVIFDEAGKIVSAYLDTYEITQAANFTTWPGLDAAVTLETATAQVAGWETKRERGDAYGMAAKATTGFEWYVQMNNYQKFFVGKTVEELRTWFGKSTGATGKPIVATTTNEAELAKLNALTDAEKAALVDVVSSATMSLSDSHGLFLEAIEEAYANRVAFTVPVK